MKKLLSVVVSCYNEEEAIPHFYEEINKISNEMKKDLDFEFLFINDGSSDKTLDILKKYAKKDKRVKFISFSRNFGKEAAMYAGLENSKGDYITLMDADLQDPPYLLKEMYNSIILDGYDCVATRSVSRNGYSFFRKTFTKMYYNLINKISKTKVVDGARDFRLMTRQMVNSILELKEYNRYSKGLFSWVGYKTKWITFENAERVAGTTKWNFWKLFSYSLESITNFSTMPLALASFFGIVIFLISFIALIFIFGRAFLFGDPVSGWPSTMCIILFIGGVQLLTIGILGQYMAKLFLEVKQRPIYITKETENDR